MVFFLHGFGGEVAQGHAQLCAGAEVISEVGDQGVQIRGHARSDGRAATGEAVVVFDAHGRARVGGQEGSRSSLSSIENYRGPVLMLRPGLPHLHVGNLVRIQYKF